MLLDRSVYNITTTPLPAGQTWTGDWEYMDKGDIQISAYSDVPCKLYIETKPLEDSPISTSFPPTGYTISGHLYRVAQIGRRYVRLRVENISDTTPTIFWVVPSFGFLRQPNAPLNVGVAVDADAAIVRSVAMGQREDGTYVNVPTFYDGSMKVGITNPLSSFGEILTAANFPVIQATAVYGLTSKMRTSVVGAGAAAGVVGNDFYATSGTSGTGNATVFTKDAAVYKAGQGLSCVYTARYSSPVANSVQFAGAQNATDAFVLGYLGTQFGMFFRHWGQQEIRELTFTVGSSGATNATIVLNGVSYTVPLTAGTTAQNAREAAISLTSQAPLWVFTQVGSKVVCRYITTGALAGAFTFSHATAVAAFSQIAAGVAVTEEFVPSSSFTEGDVLDWLDPTKGNVYRIDIQYLGYGDIQFYAEYPDPKQYVLIHTIHYANENIRTSVTNPAFRIGWTAGNRTGTTPVTCYGASAAAFIQGALVYGEPSRSYTYTKSSAAGNAIPMWN